MLRCGIDIGGSKIAMGLAEGGAIVRKALYANDFFGDPDAMVSAIAGWLPELCQGLAPERLGVGSPGQVQDGVIYDVINLGIEQYVLAQALSAATGLPARVDNDARCAVAAELAFGALRGCVNGVMATFGTGIGGGLVFGGALYRGSFGLAGEIGHLTLFAGGDCACGKRGCYEKVAAVPALIRLAGERGLAVDNARALFDAADAGDGRAQGALNDFLPLAARGLVELAMLLDLDTVCVGGGISSQRARFIEPLAALVHARAPRCRVVQAALGNDAGIIGAAHL
ncbi:MAG: ROK family protein [Clostridiales bacterium]|nr:ROK family protein [Clostridiales bacterium]